MSDYKTVWLRAVFDTETIEDRELVEVVERAVEELVRARNTDATLIWTRLKDLAPDVEEWVRVEP